MIMLKLRRSKSPLVQDIQDKSTPLYVVSFAPSVRNGEGTTTSASGLGARKSVSEEQPSSILIYCGQVTDVRAWPGHLCLSALSEVSRSSCCYVREPTYRQEADKNFANGRPRPMTVRLEESYLKAGYLHPVNGRGTLGASLPVFAAHFVPGV